MHVGLFFIFFEAREQGKKLSLAKATAILERTELIIQTRFLWKNGAVEFAVCPCACKKVEVEKEQKQKQFQWNSLIFVSVNGLLVVLLSFILYF